MRIQKVQNQYFEYSSTFRIVCTQRIELIFKTCAFPFLPSYIVPNENFWMPFKWSVAIYT